MGYRDSSYTAPGVLRDLGVEVDAYVDDGHASVRAGARVASVRLHVPGADAATSAAFAWRGVPARIHAAVAGRPLASSDTPFRYVRFEALAVRAAWRPAYPRPVPADTLAARLSIGRRAREAPPCADHWIGGHTDHEVKAARLPDGRWDVPDVRRVADAVALPRARAARGTCRSVARDEHAGGEQRGREAPCSRSPSRPHRSQVNAGVGRPTSFVRRPCRTTH
jgi:hypothetical protein